MPEPTSLVFHYSYILIPYFQPRGIHFKIVNMELWGEGTHKSCEFLEK